MHTLPATYVPSRIFLDTNTQQALVDHGGPVFEGEAFEQAGRSGATEEDIEALCVIFLVATRALYEFVVSENSVLEAAACPDPYYLRYTYDVAAHFADCVATSDHPFDGSGEARVEALASSQCNYLSAPDRLLLADAVSLECDTFLTLERRLPRNAAHLSRVVGIEVLRPPELLEYLRPHLAAV